MYCKNKKLSVFIRPSMFSRRHPKEGRICEQELPSSTKVSAFYSYINWCDWMVGIFHGIVNLPEG